MKGKSFIFTAVAILLAARTLGAWPVPPGWDPMRFHLLNSHWEFLRMDQGGVIEDLQLVYHDYQTDHQDQVWAAVMNTGFYRSTWNSNPSLPWNNWTEYLVGKRGYGIDAIEVAGTEYVMCGSGILGLWYGQDDQLGFDPDWVRPNAILGYPASWNQAAISDVAFYWPPPDQGQPQVPSNPEGQYYVLGSAGSGYPAGLYKWDPDALPNPNFSLKQRGSFDKFYRDVKRDSANVLYVVKNYKEGHYNGGLYKLRGSYTNPTLMDVSPPYCKEILGFNQWLEIETGEVTYYVLYKRTDGQYWVYVCSEMDGQSWDEDNAFQCSPDWFVLDPNWAPLHQVHGRYTAVAGKPDGDDHHLWITTPKYGVLYVNTSDAEEDAVQINGPTDSPTLKRWDVRSFVVDPDTDHYQSGEIMRILFGTHQKGVWYLDFSR